MSPTTTDLLTLAELAQAFARAASELYGAPPTPVIFEAPRRPEFGDIATNLAFGLAKTAQLAPALIAAAIAERALDQPRVRATVAEAHGNAGFINVRLVPQFWQRSVRAILQSGSEYGRGPTRDQTISLEFGSANPTGPLVVVQGRTLAIGDTLAQTMRFAGYTVVCEWIINDAGSQLDTLGRSLYARYRQLWEPDFPFPDDGYPGAYLIPIAQRIREADGERWRAMPPGDSLAHFSRIGRDANVAEQQAIAARFGVTFDKWQSEKDLHDTGAVERGIARLAELGVTYERDGATWARTTSAGDDEDRVVVRADGRPTYYAADVAYHYQKLQRATHVIDILGPDHHGYIARLHALANAYGRSGSIEVILAQQITLKRGDEIIAMSKRAGNIVTLEAIIDEVGVDAARFFFVMLSTDQPLTFDLQLAKAQSNDNPVFYVQYGHARIASLIRRAHERDESLVSQARNAVGLERLTGETELALMRRLAEFGSVVDHVARTRAPHRLPKYAREIAADFHAFYDQAPVLSVLRVDRELASARLALALATQTILARALALCGVRAPERMDRAAVA